MAAVKGMSSRGKPMECRPGSLALINPLFLFLGEDDFLFIVSTSRQRPLKGHQSLIKSHVSRRLPRRRRGRALPSWIGQIVNEDSPQGGQEFSNCLTISRRVGSDYSWIRLPNNPKPYMVQNVLKCEFQNLELISLQAQCLVLFSL